jgi:hypothetical protein
VTRDRRLLRRLPIRATSSGAAAAFAPDSISSAWAWYRGDLNVTTAGGSVSEWQDQIGTRHLTAAGAAQPTHSASVAGLNSQAGVTGDGVNDKMSFGGVAADYTFLHDGSGCTMWFVVRTPASHSEGALLDTQRVSNANAGFTFYHQASGAAPIIRVSNDANGNLWSHNSTVVANSTTYQYLIAHSTVAGYVVRRNGVELGSGAYSGTPRTGAPGTVLGLMDAVTSVGVFSNWAIGEILLCNAVISAGDITNLEDYGADRYGL